ncbi:MAG: hypothetical protein Q4A71_05255 [Actinomycetaceae bacterium]|nr:hypothetical protein [Actinomycetaceae bacterium]
MYPSEQDRLDAADPNVDLVRLQELAGNFPELRPTIATNPATYDALLQWLRDLGDPEINAALQKRTHVDQAAGTTVIPAAQDSGAAEVFEQPTQVVPTKSEHFTPQNTQANAQTDSPTRVFPDAVAADETVQFSAEEARYLVSAPAFLPQDDHAGSAAVPAQPYYANLGATRGMGMGAGGAAETDKNKRSPLTWLLVVLLVMAVAGVVAAGYLLLRQDGKKTAEPRKDTTVTQPEPGQTEEPEPKKDEDSKDSTDPLKANFPVKPGYHQAAEFASPSGNIMCNLKDGVKCVIREHDLAGTAHCRDGEAVFATISGEQATLSCGSGGVPMPANVLDYDQSAANGNFACTSRKDGVTCWDLKKGTSFTIARKV